MPKDSEPKTDAEIHAEAGRMMAAIPGGSGVPAPAFDPMQKGARALSEIDEDAHRMWKVKAPKGVNGEIAAYLVDGRTVLVHQRPSGRFSLYGIIQIADMQPAPGIDAEL